MVLILEGLRSEDYNRVHRDHQIDHEIEQD